MGKFGLDFGLLMAYLVPGLITTVAAGRHHEGVKELLLAVIGSDQKAAAVGLLILLAIVLGMSTSIVRAIVIDNSFRISVKWCAPSIGRVDPVYHKLSTGERLGAYLEAKSADKRPYQFYGNSLTSITMLALSVLVSPSDTLHLGLSRWPAVVMFLIAFLVLYPAARLSHFRFMRSVEGFNDL